MLNFLESTFKNYIMDSNDYVVTRYEGKGVSLNDYYSSKHWTHRNRLKNNYSNIFNSLMDSSIGDFQCEEKYGLCVIYNSRHDPDNVTGLSKIFQDCLKKREIIKDDSKKFCKFFCIINNNELPLNTFDFYLYKINQDD